VIVQVDKNKKKQKKGVFLGRDRLDPKVGGDWNKTTRVDSGKQTKTLALIRHRFNLSLQEMNINGLDSFFLADFVTAIDGKSLK